MNNLHNFIQYNNTQSVKQTESKNNQCLPTSHSFTQDEESLSKLKRSKSFCGKNEKLLLQLEAQETIFDILDFHYEDEEDKECLMQTCQALETLKCFELGVNNSKYVEYEQISL